MSAAVFRRCGCRDTAGKQFGTLPEKPTDEQRARACPLMGDDPKHGSWTFRISAGADPTTGRRRQVRGGTYATKREAQQERNRALVKLDQGKLAAPSREAFAEFLTRWLDRRAKVGARGGKPLAAATLENYRRYAEQDIIPSRLGAMKLRDIRRGHVQAFVDDLGEADRGPVTIRRIVAVIQGALSSAVRDELIDETPARLLELPPVEAREFAPWEAEQVGHFLDVAGMQCRDEHGIENKKCRNHRLGVLFEVAVFTGLRRAELVGLLWSDVDLTRRELRVRRDTTKTDAGRRRVALDARAVGALVAWQFTQGAEREAWGEAYVHSGHVFTMEDGRPLKLQYATRLFDRLRIEAGLPPMTFHGLRHQQASLQLAAGTPLAVVSKRLGHSSVAVTADIYSHLLESTEHAAANAAASLVPARTRRAEAVVPTLHPHEEVNEKEAAPATGGNGL